MKRALYVASGVSVLFTTLAFTHLVEHHVSHEITAHRENFLLVLLVAAILAVIAVLSLVGAYFLLTAGGRRNSGTASPQIRE